MIRWLLNLINGGRNKSNVFTDTPGGINGMTWEQAKEWLDKGYKVGRIDKPKDWHVFRNGVSSVWPYSIGIFEIFTDSDAVRRYSPTPTDNMPVWYVVGEG